MFFNPILHQLHRQRERVASSHAWDIEQLTHHPTVDHRSKIQRSQNMFGRPVSKFRVVKVGLRQEQLFEFLVVAFDRDRARFSNKIDAERFQISNSGRKKSR